MFKKFREAWRREILLEHRSQPTMTSEKEPGKLTSQSHSSCFRFLVGASHGSSTLKTMVDTQIQVNHPGRGAGWRWEENGPRGANGRYWTWGTCVSGLQGNRSSRSYINIYTRTNICICAYKYTTSICIYGLPSWLRG